MNYHNIPYLIHPCHPLSASWWWCLINCLLSPCSLSPCSVPCLMSCLLSRFWSRPHLLASVPFLISLLRSLPHLHASLLASSPGLGGVPSAHRPPGLIRGFFTVLFSVSPSGPPHHVPIARAEPFALLPFVHNPLLHVRWECPANLPTPRELR